MISQTRHAHPVRPSPKWVLATIRTQSCYPALRSLINVSLAITFALCALGGVVGTISVANSYGVFRHGAEASPLFGLSLIGVSAVVAFLAFTGRQAVFVMFDIADLLVAQRADAHVGPWQ
jgi:hypothetical protein